MTPCSSPSSIACCAYFVQKNFLLQRSSHSFRTIFVPCSELCNSINSTSLRTVEGEVEQQLIGCCFETWMRPLRRVAGPLCRPHASIKKRALRCTTLCQSHPSSLPVLTSWATPCWICFSAKHFQNSVNFDWHEHFVEFSESRAACVCITTEREKRFKSLVSFFSCRFRRFGPWCLAISTVRVHGVSICWLMSFLVNLP